MDILFTFIVETQNCQNNDSFMKQMLYSFHIYYESRHEKTCLCHMRTTKAQISTFVVRCL